MRPFPRFTPKKMQAIQPTIPKCLFWTILLLILGISPLYSQLNLQVQPSRISGVAPLYVFFDATSTLGLEDTNALVNADFNWDFDASNTDPNGNWESIKGMVAGHVFEEAGIYTVACTATAPNGDIDTRLDTITVTPFLGTTYYVSAGGNDANDGLSSTTAWQSANFAFSQLGPNERILFQRGDTFPIVNAQLNNLVGGKMLVGAFGSGNRPVLSGSLNEHIIELNFVEDLVFEGLELDVNTNNSGRSNFRIEDCSNVLLLDLEMVGSTSMAIFTDDCDVVGIFDNYVHDFGVLASFSGDSERMSWVGNTIDELVGTPQPEHGIRVQGGEKQFLAYNELTHLTNTKTAISIRGDGQRHVVLYRNKMDRILGVNPQNSNTVAAISQVTIEGNYIGQNPDYTGSLWENSANGINIEATNIAIRNNVIDGYLNGIGILHDFNGVVSGWVDVYHNTYNWRPVSPSSSSGGRLVRVRDVSHVNVQNNLITAPVSTNGEAIAYALTNSNILVAGNAISTPIEYDISPLPGSAAHNNDISNYQISPNSSAIQAGLSAVPVFYDANNLPRNGNTPDAGAFERSAMTHRNQAKPFTAFISPNPTEGAFEIVVDGMEGESRLEIFNLEGVQILKSEFRRFQKLDVSNFPSGVYFWQVYQPGSQVARGKLVKL